jgi:predicted lipid-binding transport protein (Tim44 family)
MRLPTRLRSAVLLAAFISGTAAWARPGGGQDYRGSSSSSSSGSSSPRSATPSVGGTSEDSGGSGDGSADPRVVVPVLLLLLVGVFAYMARDLRSGLAAERAAKAASPPPQRPPPPDVALADDRLHARARALFQDLNAAWARGDMSPVRTRLSDATCQRLATQLKLLHAQGMRNVTADWGLLELRAIASERDPVFDTVHLLLRAQGRDRDVPAHLAEAQALVEVQRSPVQPYVEVWTFLRHRDARAATTAEGGCPGCGAPLELGETATCAHCGAIVNSGRYDWVLAEITQAAEARPPSALSAGEEALRAADPGFSRQVLEDRTSLLFWRWVQAQATGDTGLLAKVATPQFVARVAGALAGGAPQPFRQCAVGSVELTQLRLEPERQVAVLEVRWSVERSPRRSVLELHRRAGAMTPEAALSTARCPACRGPLGDNGQPACDYCGEQLAASPRDWVLAGVA